MHRVIRLLLIGLNINAIITVYVTKQSNGRQIRKYFIAAVEGEWNYAPRGYNLVNDNVDIASNLSHQVNTTVTTYRKVVYREFTDGTFSTPMNHPKWLGILGPTIKGETGDVIEIVFKNLAKTRNYSMHPHGVFYLKDSEGALYRDGTNKSYKSDDGVPPGGNITYIWNMTEARGPKPNDANCQTWAYHSHNQAENDMNTGLIGALLICKKGTLDKNGLQIGVNREYILLFKVFDESLSWYFKQNEQRYLKKFPDGDIDFFIQTAKYTINGYLYGNLPGLEMCAGDKISWHLIGLGSVIDIHTTYFHGNILTYEGHRTDSIVFLSATFATGIMEAINVGKWLIACQVNDHLKAGMKAFYEVKICSNNYQSLKISVNEIREYFIAAEEVVWDYAPSNKNLMNNVLLEKDEYGQKYAVNKNNTIGRKYVKAQFVQYSDNSFTKKVPAPNYMGILGPVIRGEEGDMLKIYFLNKASQVYSLTTHGVLYNKANEGSSYNDNSPEASKRGGNVKPGESFIYDWYISPSVAPTKSDPNCLTWWYTSGADTRKDSESGLNGILLTCKKGTLDKEGRQKGVKEFSLMFSVFDENLSWYIEQNVKKYTDLKEVPGILDDVFNESNLKYNINGYIMGNLPGLEVCKDETISWHIMQKGHERNAHNFYVHGHTFRYRDQISDSLPVFPGIGQSAIMKASNPGIWALECRTTSHLDPGMRTLFTVKNCPDYKERSEDTEQSLNGIVRVYYIAAVEKIWNYLNNDIHIITEEKLLDNEDSSFFVTRNETYLGTEYKKVFFRQFTDNTFKKEVPHPNYLGVLGPYIKAQVGDTIKVIFKNLASRNYSMHAHGVGYDKFNEGWYYNDGTSLKPGDAVAPGNTFTYIWTVSEKASPSNNDFNCSTWAYYSAVDTQKDINSGLIGPLIICKKGILDLYGKRKDVNREFALLFTIMDENLSWYIDYNIKTYSPKPQKVIKDDLDFMMRNRKYSINGRLYGQLSGFTMQQNEHIAWYLMSVGSNFDVHTAHFHGQTVVRYAESYHVEDVINLYPGTFTSVEMVPDNPGIWLLHCHINYHSSSGMSTLFEVLADKSNNKNAESIYS